jgi:quinol monooxygenase YgiN
MAQASTAGGERTAMRRESQRRSSAMLLQAADAGTKRKFAHDQRRLTLVTKGLFVRLEAKPGREDDVDRFLRGGLAIVEREPATTAWLAIRMGPSTFAIFDAFPDEAGRQAHLSGGVAQALKEQAPDLFSGSPMIEEVDVLASKLPG